MKILLCYDTLGSVDYFLILSMKPVMYRLMASVLADTYFSRATFFVTVSPASRKILK